ncbi:MAG: hypothetical protein E6363_12445 [Enterobacter sp.]|nr:hypothetical protein [Enterobacter sp.]
METLAAINRWLAKQHVVTWCVCKDEEMWCANAFYYYDPDQQAKVAGTVNGQPKTVALIRGVQFKGEIRRLEGEESDAQRKRYTRRFPVAAALKAPVWEIRLDELKFTDNTLGFGKKLHWLRTEQA